MVSNTPTPPQPVPPSQAPTPAHAQKLLAIAVGNTRARWGVFTGRELTPGGVFSHNAPHDHHDAPHDPHDAAVGALRKAASEAQPEVIALASVDDGAASAIEKGLAGLGVPILRVGRDIQPPLTHTLEDASTLGIDRALNGLAAYSLLESAVAVVDAGSAITVDFVDGEGTFHGGIIAPGCSMMLEALHTQTAALPRLVFDPLAGGPPQGGDARQKTFGRDTAHAMQLGVAAAARGLVRDAVERFAEFYEAFPRVIGTGGDAAALYEADEFVERIVPDLQLIGIQRTVEAVMQEEGG